MKRGPAVITDEGMLARIRDAVHAVEPRARLILYGSRARGEARPNSDWDLLVLVEGDVDRPRSTALDEQLRDALGDTEAEVSPFMVSEAAWQSPRSRVSPFHLNVEDDGIELTNEGPVPVRTQTLAPSRRRRWPRRTKNWCRAGCRRPERRSPTRRRQPRASAGTTA